MPHDISTKEKAVTLRKCGASYAAITEKLGVPKSTLSYWFQEINLNSEAKQKIQENRARAFREARKKALAWHRKQKRKRVLKAENDARIAVSNLDIGGPNMLDALLSFLYWGEGFKKSGETGMGSSDPKMLQVFIAILERNYGLRRSDLRCELMLRNDQNPKEAIRFWSKALDIPAERFRHVNKDKRTKGSKTRNGYHGVCAVRCGNIAIMRKLLNISKQITEEILSPRV